MRKAIIVTALVAGFIGFVFGNAFWYLASPLWIDIEVSERLAITETTFVDRAGKFKDADSSHRGSGNAQIFVKDGDSILRFSDFKVTNGPDLKVYLVAKDMVSVSSDVTSDNFVSLGKLKGNIGDQNYDIPADVDLNKFKSVVIWCEAFGVLFSSASLTAAQM